MKTVILRPFCAVFLLGAALSAQWPYQNTGYTKFGEWAAEVSAEPLWWSPGLPLNVQTRLTLTQSHFDALAAANIKPDGVICLLTAERTFDGGGKRRFPDAERISTLLTPSGLPIEGGAQGAVTNRFGYPWRTPVDQFIVIPLAQVPLVNGQRVATFTFNEKLPADLPPGVYRLRIDYGVAVAKRYYSLNGETFGYRSFPNGRVCESHLMSPPIRANGMTVNERWVDGSEIAPRVPWVLLNSYNSNGYRGVIADEDQSWVNIASRNLIHDDIILPMFDVNSNRISYSLEPQLPADTIETRSNIPWDPNGGEITVSITDPDGKTVIHGPFNFAGLASVWPTTKKSQITAWRPEKYGRYIVKATGWWADVWGNRYDAGGTYRFWIAKRMTLATATFQGMAYPVGNRYGRDIGFAPAVPADVEVVARLFANSNPKDVREVRYTGKATSAGTFGAAQGMIPLNFDAPGEYWAQVTARYRDHEGHLWVCSMKHAGVVYPADSAIVARGKKVVVGGKPVDRGDTQFEGWVDPDGTSHLAHINFPYNAGDVLLIASDGQGANKIEPVLLYEPKDKAPAWDSRWNSIGATNLRVATSNGYSPHLFPEYITTWAYYYGAAPRPGFMGRFLVGEDNVRAPYWSTSPNSFGGQVNASNNGDLPGDIYRLIGGVVLREQGKTPQYAGYIASAFLLPQGSKANRVISPGAEDVMGPHHMKSRFFLVGTRPGMTYEVGTTFAPALQIDPILPVNINFTLEYPDGRSVVAAGVSDSSGSFVGKDRWPLDIPGLYRYRVAGEWEGHRGYVPGLPETGGELYVIEPNRPADVPRLTLDGFSDTTFNPEAGAKLTGRSTAEKVYFAAVIPGAVLDQGYVEVKDGKFEYTLLPRNFAFQTQTYDNVNRVSGKSEIFDVIHLTFFSKEKAADGRSWHSFQRVIIRGNRVFAAR